MKVLLHKTIVYRGMKYVKGTEVNVDEKDIEELQVYGTLIDTLPVRPLEAEIKDEKPLEDIEATKEVKTPKKATTTTRKATTKKTNTNK